jgi:hypothetical protein
VIRALEGHGLYAAHERVDAVPRVHAVFDVAAVVLAAGGVDVVARLDRCAASRSSGRTRRRPREARARVRVRVRASACVRACVRGGLGGCDASRCACGIIVRPLPLKETVHARHPCAARLLEGLDKSILDLPDLY